MSTVDPALRRACRTGSRTSRATSAVYGAGRGIGTARAGTERRGTRRSNDRRAAPHLPPPRTVAIPRSAMAPLSPLSRNGSRRRAEWCCNPSNDALRHGRVATEGPFHVKRARGAMGGASMRSSWYAGPVCPTFVHHAGAAATRHWSPFGCSGHRARGSSAGVDRRRSRAITGRVRPRSAPTVVDVNVAAQPTRCERPSRIPPSGARFHVERLADDVSRG
jgi:hypothetical protein